MINLMTTKTRESSILTAQLSSLSRSLSPPMPRPSHLQALTAIVSEDTSKGVTYCSTSSSQAGMNKPDTLNMTHRGWTFTIPLLPWLGVTYQSTKRAFSSPIFRFFLDPGILDPWILGCEGIYNFEPRPECLGLMHVGHVRTMETDRRTSSSAAGRHEDTS